MKNPVEQFKTMKIMVTVLRAASLSFTKGATETIHLLFQACFYFNTYTSGTYLFQKSRSFLVKSSKLESL